MNKDKRERFERLSVARTTKVLEQIRLIGNLGNRNNYEYEPWMVEQMFEAIENELAAAKKEFEDKPKKAKVSGFSYRKR